jgi:predicted SprT family Zn-dependent metalloprotease
MKFSRETFLVEQWIAEACELGEAPELIERIELEWSRRLVLTLGKANRLNWTIKLAEKAWFLISLDERRETVFHEVAHLIALHEGGLKAWDHGPTWRRIMAKIGYPRANACHDLIEQLSTIRRKNVRVIARCQCDSAGEVFGVRRADGTHLITRSMEAKIKANPSICRCRFCRCAIVPTGEIVRV